MKYADKWRKEYDKLSFEDHKRIYNHLETLRPYQVCFNKKAVKKFLTDIPQKNLRIIEIGGWKGELADTIFHTICMRTKVKYWHNYDLCSSAIKKNVCESPNYKAIELQDYVWNLDIWDNYNVCILSHILEHIKFKDVKKLFSCFKNIDYIYIDAPIRSVSNNWDGKRAMHILEVGWKSIRKLLRKYKEKRYNNHVRFYEKHTNH